MTQPIPEGFTSLTPHITVKDADAAIRFYTEAFGAQELFRVPMGEGGDAKIGYAEIQVGDARLMLNEEFPEMGSFGPPDQGGGVVLHHYVEDADAAFARAVKAGAEPLMPVSDMFWGDRYGVVKDPFGHRWSIGTHTEDVPPAELAERAKNAFA